MTTKDNMTNKNFKIKVYKDVKNEWRWSLVSSNGRTVADSSEGYKRHASCVNMARKIAETSIDVVDSI
jgi:uncharacterized protein YegP (UPF0339 family)